jgi:signal transduction histidine kinase
MAAGAVFQVMHGRIGAWPGAFGPATLALLADVAVNSFFVAVAQRVFSTLSWAEIPKRIMVPGGVVAFLATYTAYGLFAIIFSHLYIYAGNWAFLAFAAPLGLGREVFARGKQLVETAADLASRQEALERVSGTIADERRDERSRIAASLHDDVLQALYNVSIHAQVVREDLRSGQLLTLEDDVPRLVEASEAASRMLREVIRGLRTSSLGRYGLCDTLDLLAAHLQDERGVKIRRNYRLEEPSPEQQLLIYQIAREALMNAVNHAGARLITLSLHETGDTIRLSIEDDGKGFDTEQAACPEHHFGLELMKERAELAGGEVIVQSRPGKGTFVTAKFPRQR